MTNTSQTPKEQLLDAALMHVAFDGWSEATFKAAVSDTGMDPTVARAVCPRGAVDLAVAYHKRGDQQMIDRMKGENMTEMKFSAKVAAMVRFRLEAATDKEAVRRGTTLFALPQYAPEGAKLVWGTADAIWAALGDTSEDVNWYTKRATLSAVYSSTVLFWLGDTSEGHADTRAFIDRRIGFTEMSDVVARVLDRLDAQMGHIDAPIDLDNVLQMDHLARCEADKGMAERQQ